jgi:hypothetical protein
VAAAALEVFGLILSYSSENSHAFAVFGASLFQNFTGFPYNLLYLVVTLALKA